MEKERNGMDGIQMEKINGRTAQQLYSLQVDIILFDVVVLCRDFDLVFPHFKVWKDCLASAEAEVNDRPR